MTEKNGNEPHHGIHFEGHIPVFESPQSDEEQRRQEANQQEANFKSEQIKFQAAQVAIQRQTLTTQILLVAFSLFGLTVSIGRRILPKLQLAHPKWLQVRPYKLPG